ncbi:MAG: hypothetical protein AAB257_03125 [Nitrospinota bacterium]
MKKLSLSVLIIAFVLTASIVELYAAATTASLVGAAAAGGAGATGSLNITASTFARQSADLSFTTSNLVYLSVSTSAATLAENYTVTAGHQSGNKAYGMDSTGGPIYAATKTAGSATITVAPAASATGAATWATTTWTAQ